MEPFKFLTVKEIGFYSIPAMVGSIISYMFGGWTPLLELLFIFMAADYFTGLLASIKEKKGLNSQIGFWGLIKKTLMLLSVYMAYRIEIAFEVDWVMSGAIFFWLANECISLSENYGRMGLKMPTVFKKFIAILKDKEDKPDSKEKDG